jgi:hypothetical protein
MRLVLVGLLLGAAVGCGSDTPPTAPLTQKQLEKEKSKSGPGGPAGGGSRSK